MAASAVNSPMTAVTAPVGGQLVGRILIRLRDIGGWRPATLATERLW